MEVCVVEDKGYRRQKTLRRLRLAMARDNADPAKLSKWFKLMECKKKLFTLEDEINRITKELKNKSAKR